MTSYLWKLPRTSRIACVLPGPESAPNSALKLRASVWPFKRLECQRAARVYGYADANVGEN